MHRLPTQAPVQHACSPPRPPAQWSPTSFKFFSICSSQDSAHWHSDRRPPLPSARPLNTRATAVMRVCTREGRGHLCAVGPAAVAVQRLRAPSALASKDKKNTPEERVFHWLLVKSGARAPKPSRANIQDDLGSRGLRPSSHCRAHGQNKPKFGGRARRRCATAHGGAGSPRAAADMMCVFTNGAMPVWK